MDGSPTWRMVVASTKGTIHLVDATPGSRLAPGTVLAPGREIATLVTSHERQSVVAPHGGTIVEWLVEDGDPVAPGQPIVRLHPEAVS
jgi:[acyl-carrier-protein] S-malonyltransferase